METTTTSPTDQLIAEFATVADIDHEQAAARLADLDPADLDKLAEAAADLFIRNAAAGHSDPIGAAHRRVGMELGRSFAQAEARKEVGA